MRKTCFSHMWTTKAKISLRIPAVWSAPVCYLDSIIPLVSISKISSLQLASVAVQASLSLPWSQTPKTGFLVTRLIWTHGNQSFDLICPKTLCSLSPTPVMLHIKFDLGWPAGFRDIQVWKCGRRRTTDDRRRRTDDGPLLYYKLTLWAFTQVS